MFLGEDLIISLNRPEYLPLPEGYLSELAASVYKPVSLPSAPQGQKLGLIYRSNSPKKAKRVHLVPTEPMGQKLNEFAGNLENFGFLDRSDNSSLAFGFLESIKGTESKNGNSSPASPLSPGLALMQNYVGLLNKANPPALSEIMEGLFDLGGGSLTGQSLAETYATAISKRLKHDPMLSAFDSAICETVWGGPLSLQPFKASSQQKKLHKLAAHLGRTPFSWFAKNWLRLTSEEWVLALPARVWVDWASTVIRAGYAFGYLWEVSWYVAIAREVLSDESPEFTVETLLDRHRQVSPETWRSSDSTADIRDLSSSLKWHCSKGAQIRSILSSWLDSNNALAMELGAVGKLMKDDQKLKEALNIALQGKRNSSELTGSAKNLWEAIRYTLTTRDSGDHFGYFKTSGTRYLFASPGLDWIAAIASLSSAAPGVATNFGAVLASMRELGINPDSRDILKLLEQSGLARGSADADLGVRVETAFSGAIND